MIVAILLAVAINSVPTLCNTVELSDADFAARIGSFDPALVMFYAPWCGHCKQLKPEFDKASIALKKIDPPVHLLKVDCTGAGKKTCEKFSVSGFPTLKIFKKGEFWQEYEGPRDRRGIVKHMVAKVGPSVKQLKNQDVFDKFVSHKEAVVVGFFNGSSPLKDAYVQAADDLREKVWFGIASVDLPESGGTDGIVIHRPKMMHNIFEPSQIRYEGPESKSDITSWIKNNLHGLVGHRKPDNEADFATPLVVAYYDIDYDMNAKGTNYWRNRILKVAQNFKDVRFAISNTADYPDEFSVFGKDDPTDKPVIGAFADDKKFSMESEFSVDALTDFVTKLKNKELDPVVKSQPVPEDNSAPVKVAVGKNFDDVVIRNGRDTIVEFYAPWCGHCKKLAPVWDKLGEEMADEDVDVVKIDATDNDYPSKFQIKGFPTIYWLPKDGKDQPVLYNGGKNFDAFVKYIAKHATQELKNYDRTGNPKKKDEL